MLTFDFSGKSAIVTGAGSGIGFEIARQLSLAGASVLLNDLDEGLALSATETIRSEGGMCQAVPGNAGDLDVIRALVNRAVEQFGKLDLVVANAGITTFGGFLDYSEEQFDRLTQLNLKGSYFLAQAAARQMIAQKTPGRILFMSSVTGLQAHPDLAAYGMTKAALIMLARSLGAELGPFGITVNTIAPGATLTERTQASNPAYAAIWNSLNPTGHVSQPKDIASTALFLLSEEAAQITSQCIVVDGGWTAVSPPPPTDGPDPA